MFLQIFSFFICNILTNILSEIIDTHALSIVKVEHCSHCKINSEAGQHQ